MLNDSFKTMAVNDLDLLLLAAWPLALLSQPAAAHSTSPARSASRGWPRSAVGREHNLTDNVKGSLRQYVLRLISVTVLVLQTTL